MRLTQPVAATLVALTCFGCRDNRDEAIDTQGSTSDPTIDPTTGMVDSSSSSSGTTDPTIDPDSSGSSTTEGPVIGCEFVQCGAGCCDDDEECVLQVCQPACDSGIRCGTDLTTCCDAGDVCLQPECVTPGAPCLDSYDCPEGEFCEPTLQQCLPSQDPVTCELVPEFGDLELVLEWSWETDPTNTMPAIGDIDGDQLADVIVNTRDTGGSAFAGEIVVLEGASGIEKLRIEENPGADSYGSYMRSTPALADVDGNGLADIVYSGLPMGGAMYFNHSEIHAINGLGVHLWQSHNADASIHPIYTRSGAVLATNLDDDPESEIAYGIAVIDNDGLVVSDAFQNELMLGSGVFGSPIGYTGSIATAADLNADGVMEIVTGREAFAIDWNQPPIGNPTVVVSQLWTAGGDDGYPAIADLDQNGTPEVALVSNGVLRILDSATGQLWCGRDPTGAMCAGNDAARTQPIALATDGLGGVTGRGGPATIADFDGDGRPEVAVAGASAYAVYDFAREGEDIVQPVGSLPPGPGDVYVRWFAITQDESSNVTGSSVFDFQGDGAAEVMYQDECYARVFDGATGEVLVEIENSTPTIHEYPILADVDGDGNSEFVIVAADSNPELCEAIEGYTPRRGVFVYGDANDQWVRTRQVWTQHTYHVTNATSSALTPDTEDRNWENANLNNFRQNVQGEGIFNASDLSVDISVGTQTCLDETFEIYVTVRNQGSLGIPSGVTVSLWEGTDATGMLVGTQETNGALLPGGFEQFIWLVEAPAEVPKNYYTAVDGAEDSTGVILECNEDNNTGATETVACPTQG